MILGTMNFGRHAQVKDALPLVEEFVRMGGRILDTARVYQQGETEELLGEILLALPADVKMEVHTKAHPMVSRLDRAGLRAQLEASLKALGRAKVEVFYLHSPDELRVGLEDSLEACNELFLEGKFLELGMSNYASWDVARAHYLCEKRGWVKPTVYQGMYSALNRSLDLELLPMARAFGMRVYVYNPLCGGMLTGRYGGVGDEPKRGRFSPEFDLVPDNDTESKFKGVAHKMYRARYWNAKVFAAVDAIRAEVRPNEHTMADAALVWCAKHSSLRLDLGDGVIFGASGVQQVTTNATALTVAKPMHDGLLQALNNASTDLKPEGYFRGYDVEAGKSYQFLNKF